MDPHGPELFVVSDRGLNISSASASKWKDGETESLPTSDRFGEGELEGKANRQTLNNQ